MPLWDPSIVFGNVKDRRFRFDTHIELLITANTSTYKYSKN